MAGGLGGLGGFGSVLGALGQSLLTSPRENPFQGLPQALQASAKDREHQAALLAMSTVAEKLGVPKELAASPEAMKLFIDHINATKLNQLRQQAAQGGTFTPPEDSPTSQPSMSVPGLQGSSGISTNFNVAGAAPPPGGAGGLDGPGGLGGAAMAGGAAAPSFGEGAGRSGRPLTLRQGALSGSAAEKGRAVFNGLVARGLSPVAAASITGNIRGESAFNTAAIGDQGTSGGLAQWHNERWSALKQRAAQQGKPWTDLDVQLDHLVSELKGRESGALAAVNAAKNPQEGALAFMRKFERPSNKAMAESGPLRASAAASAFNLYGRGANQVASADPTGQAASNAVPLPPPRPVQLASTDPNMPLPSTAMQRVMDEARARGIGQNGPGIGQNGPDSGPGIGQSGAPLNQVAAGRTRSLSVPIPPQTNIPPTPAAPAPVTSPPVGTGDTRTKAAARAEFQRGMNILAASNGDPVLMKQAEVIMQSARKYLEPSDVAKRIAEAGLTGTPVGRALNAGLPATAVEQLTEQLIPGYVSPSTLEQKKYLSAEDQRQLQNKLEREKFANTIGQQTLDYNLRTKGAELEQNKFNYERYKTDRAYRQQVDNALIQNNFERQRLGFEGQRVGLEGEKFENTKTQQSIENQRAQEALQQQRDIATESHGIARMTEAEKVGGAINAPERAPNIRAGQAAEAARIATETTARGTATALTREAEAATNAGRMAARLMPALTQAREAFNQLKDAGTGQFGGVGPSANNPAARAIAARLPEWTPAFQNEVNRQRFDSAMAAIRSAKTAVDLKGQGPVSNFERTLAGADLPDPAAVSAKVVEDAFTRLERQLNAALELDNAVGLHGGQQPGARPREEAPAQGGWVDMGNGVRVRRKP